MGKRRERLAWLLYEEFPCVGHVERLMDSDPIDTDVRVDGTVNFADLADVVLRLKLTKRD